MPFAVGKRGSPALVAVTHFRDNGGKPGRGPTKVTAFLIRYSLCSLDYLFQALAGKRFINTFTGLK
jgi:hypothetical protein